MLENIEHNGNKLLTVEQIFNLMSIKYTFNSLKLDLINKDEKVFLYDVIGFFINDPENIDNIIENIKDIILKNKNLTNYEILFKTKLFSSQEKIYYSELENGRQKIDIKKGLLPCPKCKSMQTLTVEKQTRSADEGSTLFNSCTKCGTRWKVNN